jgi:hypothetical protein
VKLYTPTLIVRYNNSIKDWRKERKESHKISNIGLVISSEDKLLTTNQVMKGLTSANFQKEYEK